MNPVFKLMSHGTKWPSFRLSLWLAFGLGLATLAISGLAALRHRNALLGSLQTAAWLVTILTPLVAIPFAATLTTRTVRSENFQLLRVTPLAPRVIVRGFVTGALHRMRLLLVLLVGLMPALPVAKLVENVQMVSSCLCVHVGLPGQSTDMGTHFDDCASPYDKRLALDALTEMWLALGLWGLAWVGTALGVMVALGRRRAHLMFFLSLMAVSIIIIAILTFLGPYMGAAYYVGGMGCWEAAIYWPTNGTAFLIWMLFPCALTWGLMRLAERWA